MHGFHVFGKQGFRDVILLTAVDVTDEASIVGVHFEMKRQLRLGFEPLGAKFAEEWQLPGMSVEVFFQVLILLVRFWTKMALERLFSGMSAYVTD